MRRWLSSSRYSHENMDDDDLEEQDIMSNQLEYPALIWLRGGDGRRDEDSRAEKMKEIEVSTSLSEFR